MGKKLNEDFFIERGFSVDQYSENGKPLAFSEGFVGKTIGYELDKGLFWIGDWHNTIELERPNMTQKEFTDAVRILTGEFI